MTIFYFHYYFYHQYAALMGAKYCSRLDVPASRSRLRTVEHSTSPAHTPSTLLLSETTKTSQNTKNKKQISLLSRHLAHFIDIFIVLHEGLRSTEKTNENGNKRTKMEKPKNDRLQSYFNTKRPIIIAMSGLDRNKQTFVTVCRRRLAPVTRHKHRQGRSAAIRRHKLSAGGDGPRPRNSRIGGNTHVLESLILSRIEAETATVLNRLGVVSTEDGLSDTTSNTLPSETPRIQTRAVQ